MVQSSFKRRIRDTCLKRSGRIVLLSASDREVLVLDNNALFSLIFFEILGKLTKEMSMFEYFRDRVSLEKFISTMLI